MTITRLKTGLLLLALCGATPAPASWRADCHHAMRVCRQTHGVSLVPTTTTSTTTPTTLPPITLTAPSQNCEPMDCLPVNGEPFCSFQEMITRCHFPAPSPACHLDLATDEEGCGTPCLLCGDVRYCESGSERACVCAHAAAVCGAPAP